MHSVSDCSSPVFQTSLMLGTCSVLLLAAVPECLVWFEMFALFWYSLNGYAIEAIELNENASYDIVWLFVLNLIHY